jgi:hypothetical protein
MRGDVSASRGLQGILVVEISLEYELLICDPDYCL